jgi:cyclopropane fatty-acyl-phospholipid synthase-like methyltransferase
MIDVSELYGHQYQADSLQPEGIAAFDVIADELVKMFQPKTAMDVGCGGGALIRGLLARGVDAYGIEGSSHAKQYIPERIYVHDLREPTNWTAVDFKVPTDVIHRPYDLVTCTDVGEHIEHEGHDNFCSTLAGLTQYGGWLWFGAAGEGQDGLGHVACEHPCYWIARFNTLGLVLKPWQSEELRKAIKSRPEHAFCWWNAKNGMLFRKEDL